MIQIAFQGSGTPLEPRVFYLNSRTARRAAARKLGRGWGAHYCLAPAREALPQPPSRPPAKIDIRPAKNPEPFNLWEHKIW